MSLEAKLSFIGAGKMAEAMIDGLLKRKLVATSQIIATGSRKSRLTFLRKEYRIATSSDNRSALQADIIILAVKPQMMATVLPELRGGISKDRLLLSIAAGITLERLSEESACTAVVRAMPNTPGRIGRGITLWTATPGVTAEQKTQVEILLGSLGVQIFTKQQNYLDIATAVSGTGPAYVFQFMEALVDTAVERGLPHDLAKQLVLETTIGSAVYAKKARRHLAQLRNEVTSPAGTSAAALYRLEEAGFSTAIAKAVRAAFDRSVELGKA